MRILYVITELHMGGAENALREIAVNLAELGHDIEVICLYGDDSTIAVDLRRVGVSVRCINMRKIWHLPRFFQLRNHISDFNPDIIHSWLFHANFFTRLVIPKKFPLICSLRVVEPRKSHILLDRLTSRLCARFLCVSGSVREFAIGTLKIPSEKCGVIQNGVDYEFFATARDHIRDNHEINGITIARITRQKGIDILLQALAKLPGNLNWKWRFVGDQPEPDYFDSVRRLAVELNIVHNIEWCGSIDHRNIVDYYKDANLFALPSRWEGQPNVLLEAMASGLPVLTSKTDGITDLLSDSPGCLAVVVDNTPESWASRIISFWGDSPGMKQQILNAVELAKSRPWDDVVMKHLELYKELTGG